MGITVKDMITSLFGVYGSQGKTKTLTASQLQSGADNSVSFLTGSSKIKTRNKAVRQAKQKELTAFQKKIYKSAFSTREDLYKSLEKIQGLDISQYILETVINDALNSFDTEEPFTITYTGETYSQEEVNTKLAKTMKRLQLPLYIRDMMEEFLTYGEYYFKTPCIADVGISAIQDTVSVEDVVTVYDGMEPLYHVGKVKTNFGFQQVMIDADELSHFVLNSGRVRMSTKSFVAEDLPEILKIGRSIFHPVIGLLQRYKLLDIASIALDIKKGLMPTLLALAIPNESTPDQTMNAIEKYEEYFLEIGDALHSVDGTDEFDPEALLQLATQFKFVPVTQDGKGAITSPEIGQDVDLITSQDKLAERIKVTIGLPEDSEGKSRYQLLKEKSRYAKKLIDIQDSLRLGIRTFMLKNMRYQGYIIEPNNLEVAFKAIQNPDVEENSDGMFRLATAARDTLRTYIEVAEEIGGMRLNPESTINFLNEMLGRYPQLANMLEVDKELKDINDDFEEETDQLENSTENRSEEPRTLGGSSEENPSTDDTNIPENPENPDDTNTSESPKDAEETGEQ